MVKKKNKVARLSEYMEDSQADKIDKMPFFAINEDLQLQSKNSKSNPEILFSFAQMESSNKRIFIKKSSEQRI